MCRRQNINFRPNSSITPWTRGVDSPEVRGGSPLGIEPDRRVDARERRVVERVEGFRAELNASLLLNHEVLEKRYVPLAETRTGENVAARVAELAQCHQARVHNYGRVEPLAERAIAGRKVRVAGQRGSRRRGANARDIGRHRQRIRRAALERGHSGKVPATQDIPRQCVPRSSQPGQFLAKLGVGGGQNK